MATPVAAQLAYIHMDATDTMIHPPTSRPCMSYCRMQDTHRQEKSQDERSETPKAQPTDSISKMAGHINPSCYMYFNPFQSISIHFNPFQSISISQHLSLSPWSPGHMSAPRGRAHGWWCQQRPEDPDGLDVPRNGWPLTKKRFFLTKHTRIDKNCMLC